MTVRRSVCDGLPNQSHFFNDGEIHKRLVPAGPDHAQVAAMNGVVDYIDAVHEAHFDDGALPTERAQRVHDLFSTHESKLLAPLLEFATSDDRVRVVGPTSLENRVPTLALVTERNPHDVAEQLSEHKVMAGAGDFYAVRVLEAMGIDLDPGVLRLSFVHYTSPSEIDQLISALSMTL